MVKVLQINKTNAGGGAAVAANRLNRALRKNGVDSRLLVQDLSHNEEGVFGVDNSLVHRQKAFGRFVLERLFFLPYEREASIRFAFSPANTGMDISKHPLVKEADIIHLHWVNQGFLSLNSLKKLLELGKPVVWTQHDMWAFTGGCHYSGSCEKYSTKCQLCPFLKKPSERDLSTRLFAKKKTLYSIASLSVVACSDWMRTLAEKSTLFKNKLSVAIPNPIDTGVYRPLNKQEVRENLGLDVTKKYILFGAANVADPRKGMHYLMEALSILSDQSSFNKVDLELLVFGKMNEDMASQLPFKAHAFNFVTDPKLLIDLYNAADVFALPSLQDNLPNTVMEALACGTPVVGFNIGGVPEMVAHKEMGYLAQEKSAGSLALGLYETLFVEDLNEYSKAAREKVLHHYSEKVVAEQFNKLYQSILK